MIASGLNRSFALYRRRNKIRTIACIVNRSPPSHRIVSDSMSTSAKNPHENDSSECITDAVAAVAAASPLPALDPAVGPSPAAAGLVIFRPLRVRVIESDPTRCPDTSARSNGAMCPRATASAADARFARLAPRVRERLGDGYEATNVGVELKGVRSGVERQASRFVEIESEGPWVERSAGRESP